MANKQLTIEFDLSDIVDVVGRLTNDLKRKIDDGIYLLTAQAHAHIVESAQRQLKSRRELYLDNLTQPEQIENGVWVVTLLEKAVWIDDGQGSYDLKKVMLASPKAKTGKNGKYITIPFKHSKAPSKRTQSDRELVETLKVELKKRGGYFKKIETDEKGKPLLGKIHSFNIARPRQLHMLGLGGQGPQGRPFAAHARPPGQAGPTGRPYLYGVRVYQREAINPLGKKVIKKDIFTFRTISENSNPSSWLHPGNKGLRIFEETYSWVQDQWQTIEDQIIQDIFSS